MSRIFGTGEEGKMGRVKLTLVLIGGMLLAGCHSGREADRHRIETPARIPLGSFFKTPLQTGYSLSPDGTRLAFRKSINGISNLFVKGVGEGEGTEIRVTEAETRSIERFFWGNNEWLLYTRDQDGDENFRLYKVNILTGELGCLTDFAGTRTEIVTLPRGNNARMIIALNRRNPEIFDPYRLDFVTGELEMLCENPGNVLEWGVDNAGVVRLAYTGELLYRERSEGEFRKVVSLGPDEYFKVGCFTPDDERVYAYSNLGRDKIAIVEYDLGAGKETRIVLEDPAYDLFGNDEEDHFLCSPETGELLYAFYAREKGTLHLFDAEIRKIYDQARNRIGEYEILPVSFTEDFSRVILLARSDRLEGKYFFYDAGRESIEFLGSSTPWLDEARMAEMKPIAYQARDGLTIHGYLTLPKGVIPTSLPLVVNPHAGPQWRNSWKFDAFTQFFANRGYAVLQVNFRGSEGYGKEFMRAGFRQWGRGMQDDITDGVSWLVEKGIVDRHRVAIFGWSYGGYAALAGMIFTPEIYACGVDLWGISNYFTFFEGIPPYWKPYLDQIRERWGDPVADRQQMYDTSPVFHVENLEAPLFIAQSTNDTRVRLNQAEELIQELEKHNKDFEYMLIEGEGHALTSEVKTIELMSRVEAFLEQNLGRGSAL